MTKGLFILTHFGINQNLILEFMQALNYKLVKLKRNIFIALQLNIVIKV